MREYEITVITGMGCAGAVTCPVPGMPTTMPDRLVLDAEAGIPPGCVCPPPICFRGDPGDAPAISTWLEVAVSVSTTYSRCRNQYIFSKIVTIFMTSLLPLMSVNSQYKVKCNQRQHLRVGEHLTLLALNLPLVGLKINKNLAFKSFTKV